MSAARVLVVEHEDGTGPAQVGERLAKQGLLTQMCRPWAGDALPRNLDDHDALLVLGGSMGPHDDERAPWLPAVRELLRQAVARDLPTLAICLGMELLTVACGGEVRRAALPEVGLCELMPLQEAVEDRLFGPLTHTGGRLRALWGAFAEQRAAIVTDPATAVPAAPTPGGDDVPAPPRRCR
ncbi:type 1 glutamine amidotransferase [Streptomyces sp. NPDC058321]|uniref:type 1 glutamine amidotransferase n=1 Tax=Streptomyces sp. NPDC058321 TaxID=3346445 RepID=UPI0036E779DA